MSTEQLYNLIDRIHGRLAEFENELKATREMVDGARAETRILQEHMQDCQKAITQMQRYVGTPTLTHFFDPAAGGEDERAGPPGVP